VLPGAEGVARCGLMSTSLCHAFALQARQAALPKPRPRRPPPHFLQSTQAANRQYGRNFPKGKPRWPGRL
jgi:hypothetical protein